MDKLNELVSLMTLEEKVGLVHGAGLFRNEGVSRLGIPSLIMSDGPMGVRFDFEDGCWIRKNEDICSVSWLPSGTAIASSWNPEVAAICGQILGEEARGRGKDVILAPGINIHRTPLCGRNFEYMSEDPYLTGTLVTEEIQNVQKNDVAVCVKHFALNNQEKERLEVDVNVSERALFEIYLPAFQAAVTKGNAYSIMCSYNRFRGDYVSDSSYLLTDILRKKWNYDGVVISDWGAVRSIKKSFEAGTDIDMGVSYDFDNYPFAKPLLEAVKSGEVSEDILNEKCIRILKLLERVNKIGDSASDRKCGSYNHPSTHEKLLKASGECVVLLKNEDVLPLNKASFDKTTKIAVIGDAATRKLAHGGGSSEIDALFEFTPMMGIASVAGGNVSISYAKGYYVDNEENAGGDVNWQADSLDAPLKEDKSVTDEIRVKQIKLMDEAVALAKESDIVIYVGGLNRAHDTEGFDRTSYELPYNQDELINSLLDVNPDTVICINSGSAINLSSFADKAKAILWNSMNGMMGGLALAEVIFGKVNPSGKLPVSFPRSFDDCPSKSLDGNYSEGIYVGYRYYETFGVKPLFCFGHGLSYSKFDYSDINVLSTDEKKCPDAIFKVTCSIENTNNRCGQETAMLFVSSESKTPERPKLELKGYKKVKIESNSTKDISFFLTPAAFAYYDESSECYRADAGEYTISIGASCEDIRLTAKVVLEKGYTDITTLI